MSKIEEFIAREYPRAHKAEYGKPMSRRQLGLLTKQLIKEKFNQKEVLDWILHFDTYDKPVEQLAACKWMCDAVIILPEDEYKVKEAVKVAKLNHVDPLSYESPIALINSFVRIRKAAGPINPATVSTLHFLYNNPEENIDVYEVDESDESRENMRNIINTHFGRKCNPWCLLQGDKDGVLTKTSYYCWDDYNGFRKRVAFKNGILMAFSAGTGHKRIWWDRWDLPYCLGSKTGEYPVDGDPLGRKAKYRIDGFTGGKELLGGIYRGDKENGWYERYRSLEDKTPYSSGYYWKGKRLKSYWPGMTKKEEAALGDKFDFKRGIINFPEGLELPTAFCSGCTFINEVKLPKTLTEIGADMFYGCTNLHTVHIPAGTKVIRQRAFYGCSSLVGLKLPRGLNMIWGQAFQGCRSLERISFPFCLVFLGKAAFQGCTSLKEITFSGHLTEIGKGAFGGCQSLLGVSFPRNVQRIGDGAFSGCTSLKEVVIPESVTAISTGTFSMCLGIRLFFVPPRWYGMFCERYGRRVRLLNEIDITNKQCA
ncbi:MAG: leucine-rich repeat domain-containing protein [Bacteroidales bacterium]|nr:leucine-rich repeat domain-containing protein [Bacteroidales bacterium]